MIGSGAHAAGTKQDSRHDHDLLALAVQAASGQAALALAADEDFHIANAVAIGLGGVLLGDPGELKPGGALLGARAAADVIEREHLMAMLGGLARVNAPEVIGKLNRVDDATRELDEGAGHGVETNDNYWDAAILKERPGNDQYEKRGVRFQTPRFVL